MENDFLSPQLYTPGSDIAVGFRPSQPIWARSGNDVVLGYQPVGTVPPQPQIDILIGDLAIDDPAFRTWNDTFILGDWDRPYYTNGDPTIFGLNDFAFIPDFNPTQDTIQLHGNANNYQLFDVGFGTAIAYQQAATLDVVGFLFGASNLDLGANYFQFRGTTPPPGPVIPQAVQIGTPGFDIPLSNATDPFGNVYIAGGTTGSLAGSNQGLRDAFVTKFDNQGNELFSLQVGTSGFDTIYGIGTDNQGNFYVTGITEGELGGPKQAQIFDSWVAKYDSNGNQQWIQQIGENIIFNAFNLDVNANTGDVFISGANVKADINNPDDAFIIKFDTNGNQQWFQEIGTTGFLAFDETYGLHVGKDGNIYATGWTVGDLGGPNQGLYDNWLARLDNNTGDVQWISQYGTPDYEWAWAVNTDTLGNVYTTGWTLGTLGAQSFGSYDAYLTKFDNQGNLQWIQQFGSADDDQAYDMFIDNNNNIFLTGYTNGNLGGINAGSFDAWVAKYDINGNQQWITQFGTPDRDEVYGISGDEFGNLFITGITQGSLGGINAGSFDAWLAKLDATSGTLLSFGGNSNSGNPCSNACAPQVPVSIQDNNPCAPHFPASQTVDVIASNKTTEQSVNQQAVDFISAYLQEYLQETKTQLLTQVSKDNPYTATAKDLVSAIFGSDLGNDSSGGHNNTNPDKVGSDSIFYGDASDNTLYGTAGDDILYAGEGNNTIFACYGNDTIYAGAGNDYIDAGEGNNLIYAGEGNNTIKTGAGNDTIYAGAGDDIIHAGAGDDLIYAGEGNNIIYAGTGNNTVYTGSGYDLFALSAGEGVTTIINFEVGKDLLGLMDGLTFEQLSITQGSNGHEFFTQVGIANSDDILATLNWVQADAITSDSFATVAV